MNIVTLTGDTMLYADQLKEMRENLLDDIRPLLPTEQEYVSFSVPLMPTIKYLDEKGNVSYFGGQGLVEHLIQPHGIDDMPIESLAALLRLLRERALRKKQSDLDQIAVT